MKAEPLVSVLTPVYNGERYLRECIASVLGQTYKNIEYIIVNNCSTDASLAIAREAAGRDSRVRVVENAVFLTSAQNHNACVQEIAAASAYVKFVHADDWLYPECVERMVALAERYPRVAIVGAYRVDGAGVSLTGLSASRAVVSGREVCRRTLQGGFYVFGSPTSLLLRASRVRSRRPYFDESRYRMHFDTAACFEELQDADFGFVHQVLTGTRRHRLAGSSYAQRMNTYAVENLWMLRQWGPVYFDEGEYRELLRVRMQEYYEWLGRCVASDWDAEFWAYHRAALAEFGERHPFARITAGCLRAMGREVGAPIRKAGRVARRVVGSLSRRDEVGG